MQMHPFHSYIAPKKHTINKRRCDVGQNNAGRLHPTPKSCRANLPALYPYILPYLYSDSFHFSYQLQRCTRRQTQLHKSLQ